ncbi:fibronectin type III domain-containing protein [Cohnella faecalis]|uniref:Fibronectin type-III domain-containing protein n=2 Tax=Cohnella faecalis TaxID=2315694 RepID=A0A398CU87_9BACL|nr:fibronectin type III domain-containing protein [Cohnella faecalis]RIE02544.1 hypothetical protein D3H35_17800 [Cohnella faecalis]
MIGQLTPVAVSTLNGVKEIAAGASHSFALMKDGTVKAWGYNYTGQLGLGHTSNVISPSTIPSLSGVKQLAAGSNHTLALMENGTVQGWGSNAIAQLGSIGFQVRPSAFDYIPPDGVRISSSITGAYERPLSVQLYLDNEAEAREQLSASLVNGAAAVTFQPIASSTLAKGVHKARVVIATKEQSLERTIAFTASGGTVAYPLEVTATNSSLTAKASGTEALGELDAAPYRFTIGSQSSGWVSPSSVVFNNAVVSAGLDIGGSGERTITRLSNGWWVVAGYTGSAATGVTFLVSKDQGQSWLPLCSLVDATITSAPAITAVGTKIIGIVRSGSTNVKAFSFDAAVQENTNLFSELFALETGTKTIGNLSVAADRDGNVHAAWTINTSGYYSIRYSVNTDGGWQTVQQVTAVSSSNSYSNLKIAIINNQPVIISEFNQSSRYAISKLVWDGSAWTKTDIVSVYTYPQQNYSVFVDGQTVHLAWAGADSAQTSKKNIRYIRSTDGGSTWTAPSKLTTGNTYNQDNPVIAMDTQGKLYIVYGGQDAASPTYVNLRLLASSDGGDTWTTTPAALTALTSGSVDQPVVIQDGRLSYGDGNPIVIYKSGPGNQTLIRGSLVSGNIYTVSGLLPDTKYNVQFEVKDSGGVIRKVTKEAYTLADKPTITQVGQSASFTISDTNALTTKYQITAGGKYWSSEGKWVNSPTSLTLSSKTVALTKLDTKKTYRIQVRAVNQEGVPTDWSNTIQLGTPIAPPAAPANVKTQPSSTSVTLTWSPVSEATDYEVEVDNQATLYATGRSLSYKHTGLTPNTLHQYRVRAIKSGTPGAWSKVVLVRTLQVAPVVPTTAAPVATAKTVTLSWSAVANAFAYEVEWDGQIIATGKQLTLRQTGLPVLSRHTYRVRALNAGGASPWSALQTVSTTNAVPAVPTGIAVTVSDKAVTIRWDASLDALTYDVEADGKPPLNLGESTTVSFTGLAPGSAHQYRIRAVNESGTGAWSAYQNVTTYNLSTPSGLIEQLSDTSIGLTWSAVAGATSYEVEADGTVAAAAAASYTHASLVPETTHTYRIRALSAAGSSAWSELGRFTTLPLKPAVPANLTATASKDKVILTWSPVSGIAGYDVELDGAVIVDNFTDASYVDTLLDPYSPHQYRIRARTEAVEGDWSAPVSIRTLPDKPKAPTGIAVTSAGQIVTLAWEADPTAVKYEVEVNGAVTDAGTKNTFKHRRIAAGSEHKYRIRTTNVAGTSAWSGLIINNTITAWLTKAGVVDMGLVGMDITDFSRYTLNVTYDPGAIEITDLSTLTAAKELTTGKIKGTQITVASFKPGEIVFTTDKVIQPDESWSGVINSIQMKAKVSGGSSITYSVIERT